MADNASIRIVVSGVAPYTISWSNLNGTFQDNLSLAII
jgi:hypothetical protein